jgi:ATP-dependent DNA ligase
VDWDDPKHAAMMNDTKHEFIPVSKYYAEGWVGNIRFGVIISDEEIAALPKKKKFNIEKMALTIKGKKEIVSVIEVGECSGFDEPTREMFSSNYLDGEEYIFAKTEREKTECEMIGFSIVNWVGKVIEVKCNEIFKDTGRLRHPRFLRLREDKNQDQCIWADHISKD